MHFLRTVWGAIATPVPLICVALGAVVMGLLGPFGMYLTMPVEERLAFWLLVCGASLVVSIGVQEAVATILPRYSAAADFAGWVLFTLLFTPVVSGIVHMFVREAYGEMRPAFALLFFFVASIAAAVVILRGIIARVVGLTQDNRLRGVLSGSSGETFLRRLEAEEDPELILLSSKDHHLDVHTRQGSAVLRMRLSDAVMELEGYDGVQVHRSHWVARQAVQGCEVRGNRMFLLLEQGHVVPVSRGFRAEVEARGLLS